MLQPNIYTLSACHYIGTTTKATLGIIVRLLLLLLFYHNNIIYYLIIIIVKYIILVNSQGTF